jgi:hypothetical protein
MDALAAWYAQLDVPGLWAAAVEHPWLGAAVALLLLLTTAGPVVAAARGARGRGRQGEALLSQATRRVVEGVLPPAALRGARAQVVEELLQVSRQAAQPMPYRVRELYVAGPFLHLASDDDAAASTDHAARTQCLVVCRVDGQPLDADGAETGSADAAAAAAAARAAGGWPQPVAEARFLAHAVMAELRPEHRTEFAAPIDALPTLVTRALATTYAVHRRARRTGGSLGGCA